MAKPAPRTLNVVRTKYITPQMYRVTLGGTGLLPCAAGERVGAVTL